MAALRRREWLALAAAVVVALGAAASVVWKRERARIAFERELAFLQGRGSELTPQDVVAAALRLPRDRSLVKVVEKALGAPGNARLLASTAVEYWDAQERADGLLPRPEHHARPIHELLPLLPAIARAQVLEDPDSDLADACLVCVWDEGTLRTIVGHCEVVGVDAPKSMRARYRMHKELLGVLLDKDPRPMSKDGFSGLVYGYGYDDELIAAIGSLCSTTK